MFFLKNGFPLDFLDPAKLDLTRVRVRAVNPNSPTPYVQQWSFGLQRTLPWHLFVQADYVGTKSTYLTALSDFNQPINGVKPYANFGYIEYRNPTGNGHYNGLDFIGESEKHLVPDHVHPDATGYKVLGERFGERMAVWWLDLVRYAESTANDANAIMRHAWRYRDYVIRSLNEDKPYDQFLKEQIAGDALDHQGFASFELQLRGLSVLLGDVPSRRTRQVQSVWRLHERFEVGRGGGVAAQKVSQAAPREHARSLGLNVHVDAQLDRLALNDLGEAQVRVGHDDRERIAELEHVGVVAVLRDEVRLDAGDLDQP